MKGDTSEIPVFEVALSRISIIAGEKLNVDIQADRPAANASLVIGFVDDVTTDWQASVGFALDTENKATVVLDPDGWMKDAVFFASGISLGDKELGFAERIYFEVRYAPERPRSRQQLLERVEQLDTGRRRFYTRPLGDRSAPGAERFQGVVLVERLLMTTKMFVPGVEIRPLGRGNPAESESRIFGEVISDLIDADSGIAGSEWSARSETSRPLCILMMENVWAASRQEAFKLSRTRFHGDRFCWFPI